MGLRIVTCYAVSCDSCDQPWGEDYAPEQHFETVQDAYAAIAEGWRTNPDGTLLCPACACQADCRQYGHCWVLLPPCQCGGTIPGHQDGCPDPSLAECVVCHESTWTVTP
jgi:hypothetical protein